ncbi:hypothetical protein [Halococcus sp. IIIV-5B]|uniref:hypothetical protein n=1 Tax=Halococcus sp. IIIV-5B TaxID=2321230 RepID=UPI000E730675|nr:hypothetical protein [Halococcus sp. IIIV-5B]RJT05294.1 hypothetical protein D3261_07905 [Halococcus sp. IIIV-5B]
MSDDEKDLHGEDQGDFQEHFAPVVRSFWRTMTSRSFQTYTISFVGMIILSASIGGVILGPYAAIQPTYGLCDKPVVEVYSPADTAELTAGDEPPNFRQFSYDELTPMEQETFDEARTSALQEAELDGRTAHFEELRNGSVVTYEGESYYTVVASLDDCVDETAFNVPLSIVGVVVGLGLSAAPGLRRWFN